MEQENNQTIGCDQSNNESNKLLGMVLGLITISTLIVYYDQSQRDVQNKSMDIFVGAIISMIVVYIVKVARNKIYNYQIQKKEFEYIVKDKEAEFARFIKATNAGIWEWNVQTGYINFNKRVSDFTGYTLEEISNIKIDEWLRFIHPEDLNVSMDRTEKTLSKEIPYCDYECRIKHKEGHWIWVQIRGEVVSWINQKKPLIMSGTYIDITTQKKTTRKYINSTEKYQSIIEISNTGVWEYDVTNECLWCSNAYFSMLGYKPEDFKGTCNRNLDRLWTDLIHPEERETAKKNFITFLGKDSEEFYDNHFRMKRIDGDWAWIWSRGKTITDDEDKTVKYVVGTHIDVTEMKKAQQKIEFLSYRDPLTGLYNRRYYEEKLEEYNNQSNVQYSLIIFDVNGLKLVNDAFGHISGDKLLKKVGELILSKCQEKDIVARMGGDEFIVLSPDCPEHEVENLVGQIIEAVEGEEIENIPISVSSGWATKKEEQDSVELVFTRAEDAMYHNKAAERKSLRYQSVQIIMKTLNEKIPREEAHSERVSDLCLDIGMNLQLSPHELKSLQTSAMLHDIGKIGISNDILNKEGPLNEEEWLEIKKHPKISYNILSSVNEYGPLAEIVLSHHERWDGNGYPNRLKGEEIPLKARIIAIADAYDAMVSDRPYRTGMNEEKALEIIEGEAGKQFDPNLVELFLDLFKN